MKEFKNVRSSQVDFPSTVDEKSSPTTVYVRENIKRIDEDEFTGWEYDEKQYTRYEYSEFKISVLSQEQSDMKDEQTVQNTDIKDNMLACVELCDMVLGIADHLVHEQKIDLNLNGVESSLAKIYSKLIIDGDITLEDVPSRYKIEVERLLDK